VDDSDLITQLAGFEDDYWWFVGRRKIIITLIEEHLKHTDKTNLKILDVGCGTGRITKALTKFGDVYGSDYSMAALKYARGYGLGNLIHCSASNLPYRSETFDIITIFDVIEHIKDDVPVIKEISTCLKTDGAIFISVPAFQSLWSNHDIAVGHFRRYNTKSLLRVLMASGLQDLRTSYFISLVFPFISAYRMISYRLRLRKTTSPKPDLIRLPSLINKCLKQILFFESKLLSQRNLPFGISLLCIAGIRHSNIILGKDNT
jgi:ubiquinone/menaquinone biosynthesis C-methylase UbiE